MHSAPNNPVPPVEDATKRTRALDVTQSFIVRAPAGSGKTRLLIQRYLALLAIAEHPEEVVAITFTRKAAAEMRARILAALRNAASAADDAEAADAPDDVQTHVLAMAVLARDAQQQWQLLGNAARLRVQTIDGLNASLTRQMPMLARFGAQPESVDDASSLYLEAARNLLLQINTTSPIADDLAILLAHLDNNLRDAESLISQMLRSRDHWLRNLPRMNEREALEAALRRVRNHAVGQVDAQFPVSAINETLALASFSKQNLLKNGVVLALSQMPDDDQPMSLQQQLDAETAREAAEAKKPAQ